jgi:hypothetical protein
VHVDYIGHCTKPHKTMSFIPGERVDIIAGEYIGRKGYYLALAGFRGLSAQVKLDLDTRAKPLFGQPTEHLPSPSHSCKQNSCKLCHHNWQASCEASCESWAGLTSGFGRRGPPDSKTCRGPRSMLRTSQCLGTFLKMLHLESKTRLWP